MSNANTLNNDAALTISFELSDKSIESLIKEEEEKS